MQQQKPRSLAHAARTPRLGRDKVGSEAARRRNGGGTDTGPLPTDAAGTAPPAFICDFKGLPHSLKNGTAKGSGGQAPCPGRGTRTAAPASPAGPGRAGPSARSLAPELGRGEKTQGTHTKLAFPPPPPRPGQESERHPTPTPPNSREIPARDRGRTGVGGGLGGAGDFCLSFCNCAHLPEPPLRENRLAPPAG